MAGVEGVVGEWQGAVSGQPAARISANQPRLYVT